MDVAGQADDEVVRDGVHQVPEAGVAVQDVIQRGRLHAQVLQEGTMARDQRGTPCPALEPHPAYPRQSVEVGFSPWGCKETQLSEFSLCVAGKAGKVGIGIQTVHMWTSSLLGSVSPPVKWADRPCQQLPNCVPRSWG